MKKLKMLLAIAAAGMLCATTSSAIVLANGGIGAKFTDSSFSDFDYQNAFPGLGTPLPYHPLQNPQAISGNVWGIFSMETVHTITPGYDIDFPDLESPPIYQSGTDGLYYFGVYGGLTFEKYIPTTQELFLKAAGTEPAYLKIYEVKVADAGVYNSAKADGPNVAGGGAFGTFGNDIITAATATLWLDCQFTPGLLQAYVAPGPNAPTALTEEMVSLSSSTQGVAKSYLDIIGGTGAPLFQQGVFPLGLPFPIRADLRVESTLDANYNRGAWVGSWSNSSNDPITGNVIPEPGTMVLLGSGLLGLAGIGRKRGKKS